MWTLRMHIAKYLPLHEFGKVSAFHLCKMKLTWTLERLTVFSEILEIKSNKFCWHLSKSHLPILRVKGLPFSGWSPNFLKRWSISKCCWLLLPHVVREMLPIYMHPIYKPTVVIKVSGNIYNNDWAIHLTSDNRNENRLMCVLCSWQ